MPHAGRRQLSLKGRRLPVGQLVDVLQANGLSPEAGAAELDVPIEAVREALDYWERNRDLIAAEAAEERRRTEPFLTHVRLLLDENASDRSFVVGLRDCADFRPVVAGERTRPERSCARSTTSRRRFQISTISCFRSSILFGEPHEQ